jgi:hypothetical protein
LLLVGCDRRITLRRRYVNVSASIGTRDHLRIFTDPVSHKDLALVQLKHQQQVELHERHHARRADDAPMIAATLKCPGTNDKRKRLEDRRVCRRPPGRSGGR